MKNRLSLLMLCLLLTASSWSQKTTVTAAEMAQRVMNIWPDSFLLEGDKEAKWRYDQGVILKGLEHIWYANGDVRLFQYIQKSMDQYVQNDGTIRGYKKDEYNIDHLNNGKNLLLLYQVTGNKKYWTAATLLRDQLNTHPRTNEGGFWHKKIYPYQMWLDGLYMGQPFYAQYAQIAGEIKAFDDITNQFVWMETHARDAKTGLLYHGWDESKQQQWADKQSGLSPHFWGRALGWYGMAMVDVLDYFPANHPGKEKIIAILNRFATAVTAVQDKKSGVWYDIVDMPDRSPNYLEASASCMLVYTLAKGIRKGYLPASFTANVKRGYAGIQQQFIKRANNVPDLHGTVSVSGLGGNPYRDGSFDYYMKEKVIVNDPKGLGAFLLCAAEMELQPTQKLASGKQVLLDRFFNSEQREIVPGRKDFFHYTWEEKSHPGFYALGQQFEKYGARLANLDVAPTAANLQQASVYIIVDPDHAKDKGNPNLMDETAASAIAAWVNSGGTLLLMANDSFNCDLSHFNILAGKFGMHFTNESRNMVKNDVYEQGLVMSGSNKVFNGDYKMFLKEISTLTLQRPAKPVIVKDGEVLIATAKYGKGKVIAVGDPWLYNEYVEGRKLPAEYQNILAAQQLAKWLLK